MLLVVGCVNWRHRLTALKIVEPLPHYADFSLLSLSTPQVCDLRQDWLGGQLLRMRIVRVPQFCVLGRGTSAHVFKVDDCRSVRSVVSLRQIVVVNRKSWS